VRKIRQKEVRKIRQKGEGAIGAWSLRNGRAGLRWC
jgi:hypothetical protein